jgi:hypothetical protein
MLQSIESLRTGNRSNSKTLTRCLSLAAFALITSSATAQTVSYNFNSGSSDYLTTFTERNGSGSYFTFGGVSNSGSIRGFGSNQWAAIHNVSFANSLGTTITISLDFLGGLQPTTASGDVVGLGILSDSAVGFQPNQPGHYYFENTVGLNNFSSQNLTQLQFRQGGPTLNSGGGVTSQSPMLTEDNWYRYVVTYTNTGTGFSVNLSLYDIGAAGVSAPVLFMSASDFASAPELAADASIYIGINGGTSGGDVQYAKRLDNFAAVAAVPEPRTVAMLALGGVALLLARRRSIPRA